MRDNQPRWPRGTPTGPTGPGGGRWRDDGIPNAPHAESWAEAVARGLTRPREMARRPVADLVEHHASVADPQWGPSHEHTIGDLYDVLNGGQVDAQMVDEYGDYHPVTVMRRYDGDYAVATIDPNGADIGDVQVLGEHGLLYGIRLRTLGPGDQRLSRVTGAPAPASAPTASTGPGLTAWLADNASDPRTLPGGTIAGFQQRVANEAGGGYVDIPLEDPAFPASLEAAIRQTWEFDDSGSATGMASIVTGAHLNSRGALNVYGKVMQGSREVGSWSRDAEAGGVHHGGFTLHPQIQGDGFTTRWFQHALQQYREQGFTSVDVYANIDVGGYTWTRWFDFDNPERARTTLSGMLAGAQQGYYKHISAETIAEIEDLIRRYDAGEHVTARQVAMVGYARRQQEHMPAPVYRDPNKDWVVNLLRHRPDGSLMEIWLGKQYMLASSWQGILQL